MSGLQESSRPSILKRKLDDSQAIEINLSAPSPPSKKALRRAKTKSRDLQAGDRAQAALKSDTQETAKNPSKQRSSFGIWIGNLPFSATKHDIRNFLTSQCSFEQNEITRVHLPGGIAQQKGNPQNKGFAYVDFSTRQAMEQAIMLSEQLLNGRRVLIKNASSFEGRPDKPQQKDNASKSPANAPSKRVFIGNLGFDVTKEALGECFKPCGAIASVHVATFEDSRKCKGYAWVEFEAIESAKAAVRGFVKVADLETFDNPDSKGCRPESPEPTRAKAKRPIDKKIWVNQVMGRPLRVEFAEDKVTRYRKRFGKEGINRPVEQPITDLNVDTDDNTAIRDAPVNKNKSSCNPNNEQMPPNIKRSSNHKRQYSRDTCQRLSGTIVEPQDNF